jgi:hypothetical protein
LSPSDVGLPEGPGRRRARGLRRVEAARLAGISMEWYTLFEMGRERAMRLSLVDRVVTALRLRDVERDYLRDLVDPPPLPGETPKLPAALELSIDDSENLAVVYDRWLNPVRWNRAAEILLRLDAKDAVRSNVLWRLFCAPNARERYPEWDTHARTFLGLFRRALGRDPANVVAARVIESVRACADFGALWERHELTSLAEEAVAHGHLPLRFRDPAVGELRYFTTGLAVPGMAGGHLRLAVPSDASGRKALRALR